MTLSEILVELLRASNNYIANQVFLEIGAHCLGGPVSLEKSLQVANEMLAAHGLAAAIHLEEGSGISRNNQFTARGLAKVLELFEPHANHLLGRFPVPWQFFLSDWRSIGCGPQAQEARLSHDATSRSFLAGWSP